MLCQKQGAVLAITWPETKSLIISSICIELSSPKKSCWLRFSHTQLDETLAEKNCKVKKTTLSIL